MYRKIVFTCCGRHGLFVASNFVLVLAMVICGYPILSVWRLGVPTAPSLSIECVVTEPPVFVKDTPAHLIGYLPLGTLDEVYLSTRPGIEQG